MEDAAVIIATIYPLQEVVTMQRRIIVERNTDIAHRSLQQDFRTGRILMHSSRINALHSDALQNSHLLGIHIILSIALQPVKRKHHARHHHFLYIQFHIFPHYFKKNSLKIKRQENTPRFKR
ncbi:unknown [Prevotella sp. CAG:604]|nr:unknown [Prevotella sp. CAG:604]